MIKLNYRRFYNSATTVASEVKEFPISHFLRRYFLFFQIWIYQWKVGILGLRNSCESRPDINTNLEVKGFLNLLYAYN